MSEIRLGSHIHATAEAVFDAIVDLRGYDRWLPNSAEFPGTTEVSPGPVTVGTTYVESGPQGERRGTVTELERPTLVAFHQPMTMVPRLLGVIDIEVRYLLTPHEASVRLNRVVTLSLPWQLKLAGPLVRKRFRAESLRTMQALQVFVEDRHHDDD